MNESDHATTNLTASRRRFIRFLAASPLFASAGASSMFGNASALGIEGGLQGGPDYPDTQALIDKPEDALNVFDLQAVARAKLPPAHYGQIATGAGSGRVMLRNRQAFDLYGIESRRLIGVSNVDTSVEVFGVKTPFPIFLAPAGSHKIANPEGEVATAHGAAERDAMMILSTFTSTPVEDVAAARGKPIWYQLYPNTKWEITQALVKRAEKAGCPAIVCTVDGVGGSKREIFERWRRLDQRDCTVCHTETKTGDRDPFRTAPMFDGLDTKGAGQLGAAIDWDFFRKLRDLTDRKLLIKGILAAEDAALAVKAGADGIIVSNHGGRQFDSGISTLESLPPIVKAVNGRIPILIDSGFRRGTDVFKGLALGATAICIGRPYLWGLAAFGARGVATALNLMQSEFVAAMHHAGTLKTADINAKNLRRLAFVEEPR